MKPITKYLFVLLSVVLSMAACKKDENRLIYQGATAPVLSASSANIVLTQEDSAKTALNLGWTNPEYKFNTGVSSHNVSYNLEIDTAGASFASPVKITLSQSSNVSTSFKVGALNDLLANTLKLAVNQPHDIEMRIVASIDNVDATRLISNVLKYTVTPYTTVIPVFNVYVPGSYQGWSPDKAVSFGSYDSKVYEGYVNFPDASTDFKFTSAPDWNHTNYGDAGAGKLSTDGGAGNLHVDGANYYKMNLDLTKLTWSYTKANWGIVGAATSGGWDKSTQFTYDAATNTLVIPSIALTADEFKFRANDAWDINLGDDKNSDFLKYGGDNLKVPSAGNYKVVLDLGHGPNYTYTLTKL